MGDIGGKENTLNHVFTIETSTPVAAITITKQKKITKNNNSYYIIIIIVVVVVVVVVIIITEIFLVWLV